MSSFPQSSNMPILSGPPPLVESSSCRQCAKTFNPLWSRSTACGHCGYEYCSKCISDGQALMPRRAGQSSINAGPLDTLRDEFGIGGSRNAGSGYEPEKVCTHCLGMLQVTAAPVDRLRTLPLKRLKDYLAAYDIPCVGPKEKEDFVQAIVKARNPRTGCLFPEAESYYRRKSVPKATSENSTPSSSGIFNHSTRAPPPRPQQARPPPPSNSNRFPPSNGTQQQYRPPAPNPPYRPQAQQRPMYHPQAQPPQARPPPPRATPPRPAPAQPPPARASPAPNPAPKAPPPPVPTILSLVSLPKSYLASLSIGTLKAILYENHVRVDFKQVLEKEELINRVDELIRDERKRLERQRIEEEREANEANGASTDGLKAPSPVGEGEEGRKSVDGTRNVPTGPMPEVERGLCVVCQDEEATLAVVDCGHLAMCAHCSDLIMATSQECPLCRTRIVTPQRLIRIYRV